MFEVSFKEFLEKRTISLEYSSYRLICDIDEATFVKNIGILFEELYYVLFFYEKEIEVVGDPGLIDDYFSISPLYLHTNPEAIDSFLYLCSEIYRSRSHKCLLCNKSVRRFNIFFSFIFTNTDISICYSFSNNDYRSNFD